MKTGQRLLLYGNEPNDSRGHVVSFHVGLKAFLAISQFFSEVQQAAADRTPSSNGQILTENE